MVTDAFVDYMMLKNTIAKGNAVDAKRTALTILAVIADYSRSMNPDLLPDSKKFKEELEVLKERVINSSTLEEAKVNFSYLNSRFIEYIKSYGLYNKTIYLFRCDDNPAYGHGIWLSNSFSDTKNPFVNNSSNTNCYEVKESWIFD